MLIAYQAFSVLSSRFGHHIEVIIQIAISMVQQTTLDYSQLSGMCCVDKLINAITLFKYNFKMYRRTEYIELRCKSEANTRQVHSAC